MVGTEGGFPLVPLLHANIIETPTYVQLGEVLHTLEFLYQLRDEQEGVLIFHHDHIEGSVVLDKPEGSVFLLNEEHRRGHGRLRQADASRFQVLLEEDI